MEAAVDRIVTNQKVVIRTGVALKWNPYDCLDPPPPPLGILKNPATAPVTSHNKHHGGLHVFLDSVTKRQTTLSYKKDQTLSGTIFYGVSVA